MFLHLYHIIISMVIIMVIKLSYHSYMFIFVVVYIMYKQDHKQM